MESEPEKKIQDKTIELEKIEDDDDDDDFDILRRILQGKTLL